MHTDRAEAPPINTHIRLPRQRLQPSVTMTVKVQSALRHPVPGTKSIVAHNKPVTIDIDFSIGLNTGPLSQTDDVLGIIIAGDQMFVSI